MVRRGKKRNALSRNGNRVRGQLKNKTVPLLLEYSSKDEVGESKILYMLQKALYVAIDHDFEGPLEADFSKRGFIKEFQEKNMAKMKAKLDLSDEVPHPADVTVDDLSQVIAEDLLMCFDMAIKKITEIGYNKEVVLSTILKSGPFYSIKDMVSTIIDRVLDRLRNKTQVGVTWYTFQDLTSLVDYMVLEMVTMLKEVKPSLSTREAMWTLLIFDLNVFDASEADLGPETFPTHGGKSALEAGSSSGPPPVTDQTTCQYQKTVGENITKMLTMCEKTTQEKCKCCKQCSGHKRDTSSRRKPYKAQARMSKNLLKVKLDMRDLTPLEKKSTPLHLIKDAEKIPKPEPAQPELAQPEPAQPEPAKPEPVKPEPPKNADYYLAGIPFDEAKGEHVPRNDKERMILAAFAQLQSLRKEVKGWEDWANVKVMQVAKRLGQDRAELNRLRVEKKLMKEKQILDENTDKKLGEMQTALKNANYQVHLAGSKIYRLESEKLALIQQRERAEDRSMNESRKLEEALCKEREALKKSESFGSEKNLLEEELRSLKRESAPKQREVDKAKRLLNETEARLAKEENETAKFLEQAKAIRIERERIEELAKNEKEKATENAEKEFKRYETEIKRIQYEIAAIKLETETKKIAEMREGMIYHPFEGTSRLEASRNGPTDRKKDRECVMCLTEEMTVVFVPCGHQVLCAECNVIHEECGMKDCPSCRAPIQKRITARFAKK